LEGGEARKDKHAFKKDRAMIVRRKKKKPLLKKKRSGGREGHLF